MPRSPHSRRDGDARASNVVHLSLVLAIVRGTEPGHRLRDDRIFIFAASIFFLSPAPAQKRNALSARGENVSVSPRKISLNRLVTGSATRRFFFPVAVFVRCECVR